MFFFSLLPCTRGLVLITEGGDAEDGSLGLSEAGLAGSRGGMICSNEWDLK